eukprot:362120-Chlamydomonas_euryale.AAC.2
MKADRKHITCPVLVHVLGRDPTGARDRLTLQAGGRAAVTLLGSRPRDGWERYGHRFRTKRPAVAFQAQLEIASLFTTLDNQNRRYAALSSCTADFRHARPASQRLEEKDGAPTSAAAMKA